MLMLMLRLMLSFLMVNMQLNSLFSTLTLFSGIPQTATLSLSSIIYPITVVLS